MDSRLALKFAVNEKGNTYLGPWYLFDGDQEALIEEIEITRGLNKASLLVTPNVDQVLNLRTSATLRHAYDVAALRVVDGAPLVGLSRALGSKTINRITGADLLVLCVQEAEKRGWRIAVLGGRPGSGVLANRRFRESGIAGEISQIELPHLTTTQDPRSMPAINQLQAFGPDIVFICLGSPKQESWFLDWLPHLPPAVYVGAGAALDFAAGDATRAPILIQRAGAEWLWRLLHDPRRLAYRYLVKGPKFIFVAMQSWREREK